MSALTASRLKVKLRYGTPMLDHRAGLVCVIHGREGAHVHAPEQARMHACMHTCMHAPVDSKQKHWDNVLLQNFEPVLLQHRVPAFLSSVYLCTHACSMRMRECKVMLGMYAIWGLTASCLNVIM